MLFHFTERLHVHTEHVLNDVRNIVLPEQRHTQQLHTRVYAYNYTQELVQ